MHSMVAAFTPYTIKRRRVEIVRGYCYRFFQCSFPCGIIMLIFSLLFIILGAIQLIYIFYFNGCHSSNTTDIISISSTIFKCNRQTMKVLGITFLVSGSVLFLISLLVTKYSRSSEENNVIRTTAVSLTGNNNNNNKSNHHHHLHHHHHHSPYLQHHCPHSNLLSEHEINHILVSTR